MICDIVIPVWNQLALTRDCVDSVLKNTDSDFGLIVIDNHSGADAEEYLKGLVRIEGHPVKLIRNERNVGFVKAANQGMRISGADYVLLLNNDTLVTRGWLKEMIRIASGSKEIGLVNPSSNNLGQRPLSGEPLETYAETLKAGSGKFVELGSAVGFCMLIKRELIDRIGVFDEAYGMGNFEDTDYSRRAVKEGYRCVRACGAYVYHREGSSFNRLKSFDEDFKRNREIYEFRWGRPRRIAYVLDSYDGNILKRLELESMRLARDGNWVWYFLREKAGLPSHSNITGVELPSKNFYPNALFRILKKKKRFDEILVRDERFGQVLRWLSFVHRAKIGYY